jgi:hypothetical protein
VRLHLTQHVTKHLSVRPGQSRSICKIGLASFSVARTRQGQSRQGHHSEKSIGPSIVMMQTEHLELPVQGRLSTKIIPTQPGCIYSRWTAQQIYHWYGIFNLVSSRIVDEFCLVQKIPPAPLPCSPGQNMIALHGYHCNSYVKARDGVNGYLRSLPHQTSNPAFTRS